MQDSSSRRDGRAIPALLVALVLAYGALMGPATPGATGHHDGTTLWGSSFQYICDRTPASQCVANNAVHTVLYSSMLSSTRATASRRAMVDLYGANSKIDVFDVTTNPDAHITQATRPDVNAFAWGQCAPTPLTVTYGGSDSAHTRWCKPQYVYWNTWTAAANKVNTTAKYNYVGCHEAGHTVGLRHRAQGTTSCMVSATSGPADPNSVVPTLQNPQNSDYDRIDNHYP